MEEHGTSTCQNLWVAVLNSPPTAFWSASFQGLNLGFGSKRHVLGQQKLRLAGSGDYDVEAQEKITGLEFAIANCSNSI
jgi:hypothetical protein